MRFAAKALGGLLLLLVVGAGGASVWFWFYPVTVNNVINQFTAEFALDTPELLTGVGLIDNTPLDFHSGKLGDYTRAGELQQIERVKAARARLDRFDAATLDQQERLSLEIAQWFLDDMIRQSAFAHGGYRVNQISGVTVDLPQFLTDTHVIVDERSVRRYLSRVAEFGRVLEETRVRIEEDRAAGVTPPDFIIAKTLTALRAFGEGGAANNVLVTSLAPKLDGLEELSPDARQAYLETAREHVESRVLPGYDQLITLFEDMATNASHDAGIWRIPEGEAIYAAALRSNTTTTLSAEDIHALGLAEVARIEKEMDAILDAEGLTEGSVGVRARALAADPKHLFANDDAGRAAMLDYLRELNAALMEQADEFFITLPTQPLEIVRVPPYAENGSAGGYYQAAALDGSRPGRFYINQKDTADNPRWVLPTLLYHEAAPGHHFQVSVGQLIEDVPLLRRMSPFSAYTEGWALYAERVAAVDMNLYALDPLGNLGRLNDEMFRAVRLVVDTGMHHKRWSREQSIEFMLAHTSNSAADVEREIERYVVWPGQATAYKVGQLAMLRCRERAQAALGDRFDLRAFHELVLMNGAMPLDILERTVDAWIKEQQAS
ncbi:MAG: hypothetical protein RL756_1615 [Pseudomonadota bacterium]|jgi:uncharacterized protein (DUF885 family)